MEIFCNKITEGEAISELLIIFARRRVSPENLPDHDWIYSPPVSAPMPEVASLYFSHPDPENHWFAILRGPVNDSLAPFSQTDYLVSTLTLPFIRQCNKNQRRLEVDHEVKRESSSW